MANRLLIVAVFVCGSLTVSVRGTEKVPGNTFEVEVKTILDEESVKVTHITVTTSVPARIGWHSVRPKRGGGWKLVTPQPGKTAETEITVLVDQITKQKGPDQLKWLVKLGHAGGSTITSSSGAMPPGAGVPKALQIHLKSGKYKFGEEVDLFTINGDSYRLLVKKKSE